MAMLAEPRRRQKWLISPRGKPLTEDADNFGNKMLLKMGWSAGKGLGANLAGEKEFVKVNFKNDKMGIGCEDRSDQWTKHETDFNSLLKSLAGDENSDNETNEKDDDGFSMPRACFGGVEKKPKKKKKKLEELSGESLEEKSKNSRARVHYKKFTRGKDTSRYSEKDLANIFGKKVDEKEDVEEVKISYGVVYNVEEDAKKNKEEEEEDDKKDQLKFGIPTINTGTSMVDYFKEKMEKFKNKTNFLTVDFKKEVKEEEEEEPQIKIETISEELIEEPKIKKEKKNKRIKVEEPITNIKLEPKVEIKSEDSESEEELKIIESKIKKEKKNKKIIKVEEPKVEIKSEDSESEEEPIIKKEKKNKINSKETELEPKVEIQSEPEVIIEPKIKKEKKNKKIIAENEIINLTDSEEPTEKTTKKKKSKKRKFDELEEPIEILEEPIESPSKKLKKTKEIISDPVIVEITDSPPKKKKKISTSIAEDEIKESTEISTVYQISTSNATVLQHLNPNGFKNSNLKNISGYGLTSNIELDVIERQRGLKPHWTELKYGIEEKSEVSAISTKKKKKLGGKITTKNLFTF